MLKFKTTVLISLVFAVAILTAGCTTFENFRSTFFGVQGESSETIKIGVLEPQTGNDSAKGELEIRGIQLANSLKPEVLGQKVELIYADTQSSIYVAETAIADLIDKKPAAVLGSYGDAVSLTASQQLGEQQIPAVGITVTNPLITENNPYYFRVNFTDSSQGRALADYVFEGLRLEQAGVVKIQDEDTSAEMVNQFTSRLERLTEDDNCILASIEIPKDSKDYAPYAERIKESGVQVIFMPTSLTCAEKMFQAVTESGLTGLTFIGSKEWHTDELIRLQSEYPGINLAAPSDFIVNASDETADTTDLYDQFLAAYEQEYGEDMPPEEVALAFDAYMVVVYAIEQAGTVSGPEIQQALQGIENFEGASGEISFDDNGEPKKPINVDVIADGKYVSVYTVR